jgi:hypothetical protein
VIAVNAEADFSPMLVVWFELELSGCARSVLERLEGSDAIVRRGLLVGSQMEEFSEVKRRNNNINEELTSGNEANATWI